MPQRHKETRLNYSSSLRMFHSISWLKGSERIVLTLLRWKRTAERHVFARLEFQIMMEPVARRRFDERFIGLGWEAWTVLARCESINKKFSFFGGIFMSLWEKKCEKHCLGGVLKLCNAFFQDINYPPITQKNKRFSWILQVYNPLGRGRSRGLS